MKSKDIEKGLELCAVGVNADCKKCPYIEKGCCPALVKDALRYIKRLKGWLREAQRAGGKKQ